LTAQPKQSEWGWEAEEENADYAVDFSKPPPTDEEIGWETTETFFDATTLNAPIKTNYLQPEKVNERIMTKDWKTELRYGWQQIESPPKASAESFAAVAAKRDSNRFDVVYGKPPESRTYTGVGITIVAPSVDNRYEELPPDPLSESGTDISQVLGIAYTFVDSKALTTGMLDALPVGTADVPLLGMDLEGLDLGKRNGETYLLQIYDCLSHHLYIVDVCVLGDAAFLTPGSDGRTTLKRILESAAMAKLFFNVRGDSYALFQEFDIRLKGIKDLQNIERASRRDPDRRRRRTGLDALIRTHAKLSDEDRERSLAYKAKGRDVCGKWGYVQFSVRPLRKDLIVYAGGDALCLQGIYSNLASKMSLERVRSADIETERSIVETQDLEYDPDQTRD
jgi:exonuclease 3'-5' domain-containing protein 1